MPAILIRFHNNSKSVCLHEYDRNANVAFSLGGLRRAVNIVYQASQPGSLTGVLYMETIRLSTKGQIVLPKNIRTPRAWVRQTCGFWKHNLTTPIVGQFEVRVNANGCFGW